MNLDKPPQGDDVIEAEHEIELTKKKELGMQIIPAPKFHNNFRKSNWCSKLFYMFMTDLINKVNNGGMKEEYIIDMTFKNNDTEIETNNFLARIESDY